MVASEDSDQYEVSPATAGTQVCLSPPPLLCSCRAQLADPSSTPHRLIPPPRHAVWLTAGGARGPLAAAAQTILA